MSLATQPPEGSGNISVAPAVTSAPAAPAPGFGSGFLLALVVLGGLALLLRKRTPPPVPEIPAADSGLDMDSDSGHPGLTRDELLILLTAAAVEVIGKPVSIVRFRPMTPMDWTWAVQGRVDIHTSHHIR